MRIKPVRLSVDVRALRLFGVTARVPSVPAIVSSFVASSTTPRVVVVAGGFRKFVSPNAIESAEKSVTARSIASRACDCEAFWMIGTVCEQTAKSVPLAV